MGLLNQLVNYYKCLKPIKINDYVKEYFEGKDTSNVINEFVFRIFKLTKEEIKYIDSENYLYNQ